MLPTVDSRGAGASILRWALAGGIAVLLGAGLLKVFSGGLSASGSAQPPHRTPQVAITSPLWSATVLTADKLILVALEVDPNRTGINSFTVNLVEISTGRAITHASVWLFTTMLDMKMAPTTVLMHPDGRWLFHGRGELLMGGDWSIRLLIRFADHEKTLHEARIQLLTPA